jgi:hypothetical protein
MTQDCAPIVLTQEDAEEATMASGITHAEIQNGKFIVHQATEDGTKTTRVSIPEKPFALEQLGSDAGVTWAFIAHWFKHEFGPNTVLVVNNDHPLREFVILAKWWGGLPYCVRFSEEISTVRNKDYALFGNALAVLFDNEIIRADFHRKYIGPYRMVADVADIADLNSQPLGEQRRDVATPFSKQTKRLLLVSYFSGPCRAVGVRRVNYWFEEIERISEGAIEVHLATATDWGLSGRVPTNVHFVPDPNAAVLMERSGTVPLWGERFIVTEQTNAKSFNTLSHYWRINLERHFSTMEHGFDWVLISGNPFSCFDFAAFAKAHWYADVILDYRDAFANSPRFKRTPEAREYARYVERGYNFQADLLVTVNETCLNLLEDSPETPTMVVRNGFDERVLGNLEVRELDGDRINFIHAGAIENDRSSSALIEALDPARHRLHHIGHPTGIDPDLLESNVLVCHGHQPYLDTLNLIGGAHCGVVFISSTMFETPTKVYDYLAMGLDVLILQPMHGERGLSEPDKILLDNPRVFWAKNTPEGIREFLSQYRPSERSTVPNTQFSREASTLKLTDALLRLQEN